jgi:hypothetical protein
MAKFILRTLYFLDDRNLFCTEAEKSSLVRPQGLFCSVESL